MNKINQRWLGLLSIRLFSMLILALVLLTMTQTHRVNANVRIINGTPATDGEFPWHVFVGVPTPPVSAGGEIQLERCGGTLITLEWVLTAAHCFDSFFPSEDVFVGAGGAGEYGQPANNQYFQSNRTSQVYIHPQYNPDGNNSDIALVKLSSPFRNTQNVASIPLAQSLPRARTSLMIVGWGVTENLTPSNDLLLKAEVMVEEQTDCNKDTEDIETLFCSDFRNSGTGGCIGDSGGGAVNLNGSSPRLVGIISHGYNSVGSPCTDINENYNTYYVNLSIYLDWIEQVMEMKTISPKLCIDLQGERSAGNDEPIAYNLIGELVSTTIIRTIAEIEDVDTGCFDAVAVPFGTYDVVFHSDDPTTDHLTNVVSNVVFPENGGTITLQEGGANAVLLEGDADSNNSVTLADLSIHTSSFNPIPPQSLCEGDDGYDARADFNEDGCVRLSDLSLHTTNFNPIPPQAIKGDTYPY